MKRGRLGRNLADAADPPRASSAGRPESVTWTAEQLRTSLAGTRDNRHGTAYLVLATTGLRRGEALGLRWRDLASANAIRLARFAIAQAITSPWFAAGPQRRGVAAAGGVVEPQPVTEVDQGPAQLDAALAADRPVAAFAGRLVLRRRQARRPVDLAVAGPPGRVTDRGAVAAGPDRRPSRAHWSTSRTGWPATQPASSASAAATWASRSPSNARSAAST
ncbi:MAG: hypothetical protein WKF76_12930 [Nocardioidaceae bacterium]